MMFRVVALLSCLSAAWSFQPMAGGSVRPTTSALNIVKGDKSDIKEKVKKVLEGMTGTSKDGKLEAVIKKKFPKALTNADLEINVVGMLADKGFTAENTLLATSLCADELARRLEDDFVKIYGNNFNLGGLSGFPFAGNTGFGAMSAHIPDDGYCLIIYGPHVGITVDGTVGKVERAGIKLLDTCCGSAIAASNYLKGITDGGAVISTKLQQFSDFQQGAVQELILPHGKRLADAEDRMLELPYALYDSQDMLMQDIVLAGAKGTKKGMALLGGIQINTGPDTIDYFHPLRFDLMKNEKVVADLLPKLLKKK